MINLPVVEGRSCDGCTKCCEGYLEANIHGHEVTLGKPCFFVEIGKGCTDYENRPDVPCKSFQCEWLTNPRIPEQLKPSNSHVIMTTKKVDNIEYFNLIEAGSKLDSEILTWALEHAILSDLNLAWEIYGNTYWLGDDDFDKIMDKQATEKKQMYAKNIQEEINFIPKPYFDGLNPKFDFTNEDTP